MKYLATIGNSRVVNIFEAVSIFIVVFLSFEKNWSIFFAKTKSGSLF